eukprot:jgi/Orpsp1_1/1189415/evm.model.d7180000071872.1
MSKLVQPYRYYCIIDFEATCDYDKPGLKREDYPNEIIQFPAVLIESSSACIVNTFNRYVKPTCNPILTSYCKNLTHITQEQIDSSDDFIKVLMHFENWLGIYSMKPFREVCFVTDGPWDFRDFLTKQCNTSGIPKPTYMSTCLDIKTHFKTFYKQKYYKNIYDMLHYLGMDFEGNQHNGLDDSINIARIVQHMLKKTKSILQPNLYI